MRAISSDFGWPWRSFAECRTYHMQFDKHLCDISTVLTHGASHLTLPMKNLPWKGRSQGHVSNFYIVDLEIFATASRRYTGDIHSSVRSRFVYDTYKITETTRLRYGWVHMFITHRLTVTLQLNFGFYLAMLCIRGTSHGPVSVCLNTTR